MQTLAEMSAVERPGAELRLSPYRIDGSVGAALEIPGTIPGTIPVLDLAVLNGEKARRILNVFVALVALLLLSPVMLLIAMAVKLTSRGPVIYRQERVGVDRRSPKLPSGNWRRGRDLGGKPFTIFKFRTMYHEMSDADAERQTQRNDPRVTRFGAILRPRCSSASSSARAHHCSDTRAE